jgi:hypothetical protein
MCSIPSSSIGKDVAAATAAGIIARLLLWNRRLSLYGRLFLSGFLKLHLHLTPSCLEGVFDESVSGLSRMTTAYTTSMLAKARKAIVRAGGVRNLSACGQFCVGTYGNLSDISIGYGGRIERRTESMGCHQLLC